MRAEANDSFQTSGALLHLLGSSIGLLLLLCIVVNVVTVDLWSSVFFFSFFFFFSSFSFIGEKWLTVQWKTKGETDKQTDKQTAILHLNHDYAFIMNRAKFERLSTQVAKKSIQYRLQGKGRTTEVTKRDDALWLLGTNCLSLTHESRRCNEAPLTHELANEWVQHASELANVERG